MRVRLLCPYKTMDEKGKKIDFVAGEVTDLPKDEAERLKSIDRAEIIEGTESPAELKAAKDFENAREELAKIESELKEKAGEIAAKDDELARRETELGAKAQELQDREDELVKLEAELKEKAKELEAKLKKEAKG